MKDFLKEIPGFRTDTRWKKIVTSLAYIVFALAILAMGLEGFLLFGGALLLGISIYEIVKNKRKSVSLKLPIMLLIVALILGISGVDLIDKNETIASDVEEKQVVLEENAKLKKDIKILEAENKRLEESKSELREDYDELVSKVEEERRAEFKKNFTSAEVKKQINVNNLLVHTSDGQDLQVRMLGVENPENSHPKNYVNFYKDEINEFIENNIVGETVYLEKDSAGKDKSARYVWLEIPEEDNINKTTIESKMVNGILLSKGYASSSNSGSHVKYEKDFSSIGSEAESRKVGLWDGEKVVEHEREQERIREEKAKEEQAKKEAEAKKREEEKAKQAAAAESKQKTQGNNSKSSGSSNQAPTGGSAETSQEVLITRTGKKYHRRACGNGDYFPASLEKAKSRGLTPCKKCY